MKALKVVLFLVAAFMALKLTFERPEIAEASDEEIASALAATENEHETNSLGASESLGKALEIVIANDSGNASTFNANEQESTLSHQDRLKVLMNAHDGDNAYELVKSVLLDESEDSKTRLDLLQDYQKQGPARKYIVNICKELLKKGTDKDELIAQSIDTMISYSRGEKELKKILENLLPEIKDDKIAARIEKEFNSRIPAISEQQERSPAADYNVEKEESNNSPESNTTDSEPQ